MVMCPIKVAKLNEAGLVRQKRLLGCEPWLTTTEVDNALGRQRGQGGVTDTAMKLWKRRHLFGVRTGRGYIYPGAQFDLVNGQVLSVVPELLALLPAEEDGWANIFWLFQPRRSLQGRRPAELLATEPAMVLQAARDAFSAPDDVW
jgi:Protein of unknown function (DUF2384)